MRPFAKVSLKLYGKLGCHAETLSGNTQKSAESWVPLEPI